MTTLKDMKKHRAQDQRIVSPLTDGYPLTRILKDAQGRTVGAVIEPVFPTPVRVKVANFLGWTSVIVLSALGIGIVSLFDDPPLYYWAVAAVGPWFLAGVLDNAWQRRLWKRMVLEFTPEYLTVWNKGKAVKYDRQVPHCFRLDDEHEEAKEEAERHEVIQERARLQGKVVRPTKYHCDTYHLILEYGHQPHTLMEIMGLENARRIWGRCVAVDEEMERVAMGGMFEAGPQSEWDDLAGKIPAKF